MSRPLRELAKQVKPEILKAAEDSALNILAEMSLAELRKARGIRQSDLAKKLSLAQPNVSQIENRSDALLSTLEQYVKAMGGEIELWAKFPDGQSIRIQRNK